MAQQTAVEWLYDRFLFAGYAVNPEWIEQAKAIEREQGTALVRQGKIHEMMSYTDNDFDMTDDEIYDSFFSSTYLINQDKPDK